MKPTLYVMAKAPIVGRTKTRLARDIGAPRAMTLYRTMTDLTLRAATSPSWRTVLAIDPPAALNARFPAWRVAHAQQAQAEGDLGARLRDLFKSAPPGPVAIIGTDAPALRRRHLIEGFRMLGDHDAVFGPADDGGFWFVGLARRRPPPADLFHGVRWSTKFALGDAQASLPRDWRFGLIATVSDLDDGVALNSIPSNAFCFSFLV